MLESTIRVSFLGVETSSPVIDRAQIVEIGLVSSVFGENVEQYSTSAWASLVFPSQGIEPEASAFHGITNEMVSGAPHVEESLVMDSVEAILASTDILCTFSTGYILEIIHRYPSLALSFSQHPCSTKLLNLYTLVPRIWPDAKENKLQYLRYFLSLDTVIDRLHPERASNQYGTLDKCWISEALIMRMVYDSGESWEALFEKSQTVIPATVIPFGRFKGKNIKALMLENYGYVRSLWDKQRSWIQIDHPDLYLALQGYME
jgi:hypothetical protein